MSRRRAHRPAAAVTYDKPWTAGMAELFDLAGRHSTPPASVRVRRTTRGMTVSAAFVDAHGQPFTARARIVLQGDAWIQTEECLDLRFTLRTAP